jgi:hypothetical protein
VQQNISLKLTAANIIRGGFANALNSIWWHKNITKNRELYIYQTIIQSILIYGAEVWQIPTREINNILSTEMDVLRRSARKSRMETIKNEHTL